MNGDKLGQFKEAAKGMGYSDEDVNSFMSSSDVGSMPASSMPDMASDDFSMVPAPMKQEMGETMFSKIRGGESNVDSSNDATNVVAPSGPMGTQSKVLPTPSPITQRFGQASRYDVFSGNVNYGTDFATKENTPVALPPGKWKAVESFSGSRTPGFIGNKVNRGYGNSVLMQNMLTGEKIRMSHLNQVYLKPGQEVEGGNVVGLTGRTGNVTGPHLDLEFYTPQGKIADVMKSGYAPYFR